MKGFPKPEQAMEMLRKAEEACELPPGAQSPDEEIPEKEREKLRKAQWEYERIANAFYTMPWIRPFLKAWMIDVKFGDENPFVEGDERQKNYSQEEAVELTDLLQKDPAAFTAKTGGPLLVEVEKFLASNGFKATDRGSGGHGGHLGYPCTDAERDALLSLLYGRFGKAIQAGLILPTIAWFKPRPPKKGSQQTYLTGS
jgi:hypothetical protein